MEKNNKNSSNINLSFEGSLNAPLKSNHNLLDKIDTIQYKGLRIPRLFVSHPFTVNSPKTSIESKDAKHLKIPNLFKKENDIYNPFKEKNSRDFNIGNKQKYYSKINNNFDLINNVEDKNLFNIFIKDDKNYNYIQPKTFVNINNNRLENKNIIFNNFEEVNSKGMMQNKINIINNNIYNINFPKFYYFNKPTFELNTQNKSIFKPIEKRNNIEKDNYSISSLNNSKVSNSKNSKSLFVVNEMLKKENIKDESGGEIQNTFLTNKRGRKQNKYNKKTHTATAEDNILRKIEVHYISFITYFVNDIIKAFIKTRHIPLFKNIDYKLKKIVNHKYFQNMKSLKIAEVLQLDPSPKMKNHDKSVNKNIYNKVCTLCPFMYDFLQIDFVTFFKEYYYNNNNNFIVNGRVIPLSERTKTFNDLINKNYSYKDKIKFIALNCFLGDEKAFDKLKFKTEH